MEDKIAEADQNFDLDEEEKPEQKQSDVTNQVEELSLEQQRSQDPKSYGTLAPTEEVVQRHQMVIQILKSYEGLNFDLVGDYVIECKHFEEGGQGVVFRGYRRSPGDSVPKQDVDWDQQKNCVAIKFVKYENENQLIMAERELQIYKVLNHLNQLQKIKGYNSNYFPELLDHMKVEQKYAFVFPLYNQKDLDYFKNEYPQLDHIQKLDLMIKISKAVKLMHSVDIVHRDLKFENILVHKDSSGSIDVAISDFGLSRIIEDLVNPGDEEEINLKNFPEFRLSQEGGNSGFQPPEEVKDNRVTFKSDIFRLGQILYRMFEENPLKNLGEVKKDGHDPYQAASMMCNNIPPTKINFVIHPGFSSDLKGSDLKSEFNSQIKKMVLRMIQKNSRDRPGIKSVLAYLKITKQKLEKIRPKNSRSPLK